MSSQSPAPLTSSSSNNNNKINVLLLSQNIGSIECNTEEVTPENQAMTLQWAQSVASFRKQQPTPVDVLVIHLQEIGGKKFNRAFNDFLRTKSATTSTSSNTSNVLAHCFPDAGWCSGLLGPQIDDTTTFTAMGSVVFLSQRVVAAGKASMWSFSKNEFVPITASSSNNNSNDNASFYSSAKFSNVGSSRKGYLLTTIKIGDAPPLNFVNLHLLNDADNTVAASQPHPSQYVLKRAEAVMETITQLPTSTSTSNKKDPPLLFLFGDFNLRLDTHRLHALLQEKFQEPIPLETKKIQATDQVWDYFQTANSWPAMKQLDLEAPYIQKQVLDQTGVVLQELPLKFGPTYLLEDDPSRQVQTTTRVNNANSGNARHGIDAALTAHYKRHARFPAWCDRIWFNQAAGQSLQLLEDAVYWTASLHPMDHLPVYLRFSMNVE